MSTKLHQIIAIEKGAKTRAHDGITAIHKKTQVKDLFVGMNKTFTPRSEDDVMQPPQSKVVQANVLDLVSEAMDHWTDIGNLTFTKEVANCTAKADVVVNGTTLIKDAPVSFLIQFEKTLDDVTKFISELPVLSTDKTWIWNDSRRMYETTPHQTNSTKKQLDFQILKDTAIPEKGVAPQVREVTRDVLAGIWDNQDFSSGISPKERKDLLDRVENLKREVKMARESANDIEVTQSKVMTDVFKFIFQPLSKVSTKETAS